MEKVKSVAAVVGVFVIPATAFVIRMAKGDTHNESEEIISAWVQEIMHGILAQMNKEK